MSKAHHLSTVGCNNALNNGQSQTGSAAPLGEKRLKNLGQIDIANARPMVFNETGDPWLSVGPPYLGPDRDCGAGWRMPNCIIDDVLKNLRHPHLFHPNNPSPPIPRFQTL